MTGNPTEINRHTAKQALRSAVGEEARYMLQLINGDDVLLAECLELTMRSASPISIGKWLHAKKGLAERSQAYSFCEAVLNLSLRRNRHINN